VDERFKRPRGTLDILPAEARRWARLGRAIGELADLYGYGRIETPIFEHTPVFVDGVGDATDIVQHERYTFLDAGGVSLTLRPEGTAAVARAYVENGMSAWQKPVRLYYWAPMFRRERPQKGRYRQHQQYGFELYGAPGPTADAEIILLARRLLEGFGHPAEVRVNSIGCERCRPTYRAALVAHFTSRADDLCEDCRRRLQVNPLRILDCKRDREVAATAPDIAAFWCEACRAHQGELMAVLAEEGVHAWRDPRLVRGLDYYYRTVFEVDDHSLGAQSTVLGGGRYDGLTARVGGDSVPAVGFAGGVERLLMVLGDAFAASEPASAYVVQVGGGHEALKVAEALRAHGVPTEADVLGRSVKAQMKDASRRAQVAVLAGGREWEEGAVLVRHLARSDETRVEIADVARVVAAQLQAARGKE
jgi:histidyl-tRNA synthetase